MRLVYLAHPIDQGSAEDWWGRPLIKVRSALAALLPGTFVFDPQNPWVFGSEPTVDARVEEINRFVLSRADLVVAILPAGVPTIGTPREVEWAVANGTPVAVMTDIALSFSLTGAEIFDLSTSGVAGVLSWAEKQSLSRTASPIRGALPFAKISGRDGRLPTRAHGTDAGFDLYVCGDYTIDPGGFMDVSCGVRVALPEHAWGRIVGRSSTVRTRNLLVTEGIIDAGYRGPLYAGVHNLGDDVAVVQDGDRVAQFILHPNVSPLYEARWASAAEFDAIPHDGRGQAGFGSTGA